MKLKSEIRNPKSEGSPKSEIRKAGWLLGRVASIRKQAQEVAFGFRISDLGFPSDFGFRISDFRLLPSALLLCSSLTLPAAELPTPASLPSLTLNADAQTDSQGVFLAQLVTASDSLALPTLRLLDAPRVGVPLTLTRASLQQLLAQPERGLTVSNWSGAEQVRISRRVRTLGEGDVKDLLTTAFQARCVQDRGELELRLNRPWTPVPVPDEPLTVRLLDLPASGVSPLLLVRFELLSGAEVVGNWQTVLQARIWREIWVTRTALRRGQTVSEADLTRERRDVLAVREPLADLAATTAVLESTESLQPGTPLYQRHLRLQAVVHRGQSADAILQDGAMHLVLKVEVLEDGAPGQIIRLRNPLSRRELRGKVQNETTILVCL
jgi:flagella basal body P-ring formation protein FlgA